MVRKNDWPAVYRELLASRRPTFESPPTTEELVAYAQGELPPEEASRIQEYLAFHPELARALAEPVPEPDEAGDPELLSDAEVESDWTRLQDRMGRVPRRFWTAQHALALAASLLAVLFLGLYLQAQRQVQHLTQKVQEPLVNPEHRLLLPDGQRGAAEPPISLPAADHFLLKPALVGHPDFPDYRLKIIDTTGGASRVVWDRKGLRRLSDDTFEIWMPRAFLSAEDYQLELYGVDGGRETPLATYSLRLPRF